MVSIPSACSVCACLDAPPASLAAVLVYEYSDDMTDLPRTYASFGIDDSLPRHIVAVVRGIGLICLRWQMLETHTDLSGALGCGTLVRLLHRLVFAIALTSPQQFCDVAI